MRGGRSPWRGGQQVSDAASRTPSASSPADDIHSVRSEASHPGGPTSPGKCLSVFVAAAQEGSRKNEPRNPPLYLRSVRGQRARQKGSRSAAPRNDGHRMRLAWRSLLLVALRHAAAACEGATGLEGAAACEGAAAADDAAAADAAAANATTETAEPVPCVTQYAIKDGATADSFYNEFYHPSEAAGPPTADARADRADVVGCCYALQEDGTSSPTRRESTRTVPRDGSTRARGAPGDVPLVRRRGRGSCGPAAGAPRGRGWLRPRRGGATWILPEADAAERGRICPQVQDE